MNMESLWEKTCALLTQDMNYVSYSTWVEGNMYPFRLEEDRLYIGVKMERMLHIQFFSGVIYLWPTNYVYIIFLGGSICHLSKDI